MHTLYEKNGIAIRRFYDPNGKSITDVLLNFQRSAEFIGSVTPNIARRMAKEYEEIANILTGFAEEVETEKALERGENVYSTMTPKVNLSMDKLRKVYEKFSPDNLNQKIKPAHNDLSVELL